MKNPLENELSDEMLEGASGGDAVDVLLNRGCPMCGSTNIVVVLAGWQCNDCGADGLP